MYPLVDIIFKEHSCRVYLGWHFRIIPHNLRLTPCWQTSGTRKKKNIVPLHNSTGVIFFYLGWHFRTIPHNLRFTEFYRGHLLPFVKFGYRIFRLLLVSDWSPIPSDDMTTLLLSHYDTNIWHMLGFFGCLRFLSYDDSIEDYDRFEVL